MPHQMFALGVLPGNGTTVEEATWDLKRLAGWRARGTWRAVEVGWIPSQAGTDYALFRLSVSGVVSDAFVLGTANTKTHLSLDWDLPPNWDGVLTWKPGGNAFVGAAGVETVGVWQDPGSPTVYVVFEHVPEQVGAPRLSSRCLA